MSENDKHFDWSFDEQDRFKSSLEADGYFRMDVLKILFDSSSWIWDDEYFIETIKGSIGRIVKNQVINFIKSNILTEIKEDVHDDVIRTINLDTINKVEITDSIIKIVTDELLMDKDHICDLVKRELAALCLNNMDKKELKKKVQEIMIKKRSYRSDVLDFEE